MLIADIKGKLTLNELIGEDFLTSSFFSVFRYLDKQWIGKFINQAINVNNERLELEIENPVYNFWPWYSNDQEFGNGAEPDVVIYSGETALIIEAKNYSGKSGEGIISHEDEQINGEEKNKIIIDQLGREYFVGQKKIINLNYLKNDKVNIINNFYLIFLTRHSFFPKYEIEETIKSIDNILPGEYNNAINHIYWVNWHKAVPILEEINIHYSKDSFEQIISQELITFLEKRDITYFTGFKFLEDYSNFKKDFNIDCLFYQKMFYIYWSYLRNCRFNIVFKNDIFYHDLADSYWNYLENHSLIQFNKNIFYEVD